MRLIDFSTIVRDAWQAFDSTKEIELIEDISARVSTNHVYKITFTNGRFIIAKLSYFGSYEHFCEDHTIINSLANNLLFPYENVLAKSLVKNNQVFFYRHQDNLMDAWVVFYNPIRIYGKLPKRQNDSDIAKLGGELAKFHKACEDVTTALPQSSKTLQVDVEALLEILETEEGRYLHRGNVKFLQKQCETFINNLEQLGYDDFSQIPVFVDWNIGNFSVTDSMEFASRWDYDWFRISSRVMDFYFFSRVVSDQGDQTVFSYTINQLTEPRFLEFLKGYHQEFPLSKNEIRFIKEAYRFFILNYVIKDGNYFFHELYASRLQKEAYEVYFPSMENDFDEEVIFKALDL
jgi:Ser/Thr protein kinase RdoA (MazF antagonist)